VEQYAKSLGNVGIEQICANGYYQLYSTED